MRAREVRSRKVVDVEFRRVLPDFRGTPLEVAQYTSPVSWRQSQGRVTDVEVLSSGTRNVFPAAVWSLGKLLGVLLAVSGTGWVAVLSLASCWDGSTAVAYPFVLPLRGWGYVQPG